jgi:hypothetical protein
MKIDNGEIVDASSREILQRTPVSQLYCRSSTEKLNKIQILLTYLREVECLVGAGPRNKD